MQRESYVGTLTEKVFLHIFIYLRDIRMVVVSGTQQTRVPNGSMKHWRFASVQAIADDGCDGSITKGQEVTRCVNNSTRINYGLYIEIFIAAEPAPTATNSHCGDVCEASMVFRFNKMDIIMVEH